jgi:hypothetical protein
VVRQFFEIMFPERCSFELPEGQANHHLADAQQVE